MKVARYFGGMRPGLKSYLDPQEIRTSLMQTFTRMNSRSTLMPKIGKVKYTLTEYEKVKKVSIPINSRFLLFINMESYSNHNRIIKRLIELKENILNNEFGEWT